MHVYTTKTICTCSSKVRDCWQNMDMQWQVRFTSII